MTAQTREKTQTKHQVEWLKKLADDEVGRPPQRTPEIHEKISGRSLGEPPEVASSTFSELSAHGNYEFGALPEGVVFVPADGSIRTIRKLGIPHVDVVEVVRAYGSHWFPRRIGYAIHAENEAQLHAAKGTTRTPSTPKPHPDLLLCIREASRAAHRERDAAEQAYQERRHQHASVHKNHKIKWYGLKDRGIVEAHQKGMVRYIGASPQGLAVYEFGDGGMSCFHSTWHPRGVERTPVSDHPETLFVVAKEKHRGLSLARVEATLQAFPLDLFADYDRTEAPTKTPSIGCWECGEVGHTRRSCPLLGNDDWPEERSP